MRKPRPKLESVEEPKLLKPPAINDVELGQLEAGLAIDKYNLDAEVSEQPSNAGKVSDRFAEAKSMRDMAKDDLKTMEAQLYLDLKAELEPTAKGRVTDSMLGNLVQVHPKRKRAFLALNDSEREMVRLEGLLESYRNKGFMITEMCKLYHSSYFADPSHTPVQRDGEDRAAKNEVYEDNLSRIRRPR